MRGTVVASWLALAVLVSTGLADAHHGWSWYDEDQTVTVSGPAEEVSFEHPHATLRVRGEDRVWLVVLPPPTRAVGMGLTPQLLRAGLAVVATGHPHRQQAGELRAVRLTVGGRTFRLR